MVSAATSPPPRRRGVQPKRLARGRSHNGCEVCKERHVKCDERQPQCRRCERAGRKCFYREAIQLRQIKSVARDSESVESSSDDGLRPLIAADYCSSPMLQRCLMIQNHMTTSMQLLETTFRVISSRGIMQDTPLSLHLGCWIYDVPDLLVPHVLRSSAARSAILAAGMCSRLNGSELKYYSDSLELSRFELSATDNGQQGVTQQLLIVLFLAITCLFRGNDLEFGVHMRAGLSISYEFLRKQPNSDRFSNELRAVIDLTLRFWSLAFWPAVYCLEHCDDVNVLLKGVSCATNETMQLLAQLLRLELYNQQRHDLHENIVRSKAWQTILVCGGLDRSPKTSKTVMRKKFWQITAVLQESLEVYGTMTVEARNNFLVSGHSRSRSMYECLLLARVWAASVLVKNFCLVLQFKILTYPEVKQDFCELLRTMCFIICEIRGISVSVERITFPICVLLAYVSEVVKNACEVGVDISSGEKEHAEILNRVFAIHEECVQAIGLRAYKQVRRKYLDWNLEWSFTISQALKE